VTIEPGDWVAPAAATLQLRAHGVLRGGHLKLEGLRVGPALELPESALEVVPGTQWLKGWIAEAPSAIRVETEDGAGHRWSVPGEWNERTGDLVVSRRDPMPADGRRYSVAARAVVTPDTRLVRLVLNDIHTRELQRVLPIVQLRRRGTPSDGVEARARAPEPLGYAFSIVITVDGQPVGTTAREADVGGSAARWCETWPTEEYADRPIDVRISTLFGSARVTLPPRTGDAE
jgi:hypothetical protein